MHSQIRNDYSTQGVLTERLGNGLQNRVERFDSARHLIKKEVLIEELPFFISTLPHFHSSFLGIHQNPHFSVLHNYKNLRTFATVNDKHQN